MWGRLRSNFAIRPVFGLAGLLVMVTPIWPIGQASAATQQRGAAHVPHCLHGTRARTSRLGRRWGTHLRATRLRGRPYLRCTAAFFSRQYISLALYPGLQIANSGGDDAKTESIRTPTAILADGIAATKPGRFAAQENGLTASGQGGSVSR